MPAPFPIIAGPVDVYTAPIATAFPVANVAPAAAWVLLGSTGGKSIHEDGVTVRYENDTEDIHTLGATGARKAFRTRERLIIEFTLIDATLESYAQAMNAATVTTLAGPPAEKTVPLRHGSSVSTRALLIRGLLSPYADSTVNLQWEIPLVYSKSEPQTVYKKGDPVGLAFSFFALQDDTNGFGVLRVPTA